MALRDMEFVQFFPTMMSSPAHAIIPNSLLAEGAVLRDRRGERFMPRYDPNRAEMTTRDILCRAIYSEIQAGNGVEGGVYMDCSAVDAKTLELKYATTAHLLRTHSIDLASQWLVIAPVSHFVMGGAWIDNRCRTSVQGLFVAGEAAGGLHGANRIGGNGLSEAVVFGTRAGREAASYAHALAQAPEPLAAITERPSARYGSPSVAEVRTEIRRVMWASCSISREEAALRQAQGKLLECLEALSSCRATTPQEVAAWLETRHMVMAALAIATSAQERRESRGAHFRADYPDRDDKQWLGSLRLEKRGATFHTSFVALPTCSI